MFIGGIILGALIMFFLLGLSVLWLHAENFVHHDSVGQQDEIDRLRSALAFYADKTNYDQDAWGPDFVTQDEGRRARVALMRPNGHDERSKT